MEQKAADPAVVSGAAPPKPRRFVGRRSKKPSGGAEEGESAAGSNSSSAVAKRGAGRRANPRRLANKIPDDIAQNADLLQAMSALPSNYNFEIPKTLWKLRQAGARVVALQFPEGLLMYACVIADLLQRFGAGVEPLILGDVTYGACCVDDLAAKALGADFLVHYGHSCLVPISTTSGPPGTTGGGLKMLYVFVEIAIDNAHLVQCIAATLPPETKLTVMGTIQFATAMFQAKPLLEAIFPDVHIPQAKPLSPGEVLGCTSPVLTGRDALVFVADGRFHLESAMIHNPHLDAYRYDPYGKALTRERYDHAQMHAVRKDAVAAAQGARTYGVILGTLGRQGNPAILKHVEALLHARGKKYFVLLLTEIFPDKLARFGEVDAWIQIACPRLSIDWGYAFAKPLLSPYEAEVALKATVWRELYPMDFYAAGSGPWTNYHKPDDAEGGAAADGGGGGGGEVAKGAGAADGSAHVGVAAAAGF